LIVSKVIHNSYNVYENYITIKGGEKAGIKPDMGVVNSLGIIGIIDNTSEKYATVMSILNKKSQIKRIHCANRRGTRPSQRSVPSRGYTLLG
jgi:rod shape-determining protein MreC